VAYLLKSKNYEARETAVASEWLWNNNLFFSNGRETHNGTMSVATKKILNTGPLLWNGSVNVPAAKDTSVNGVICAGRAEEL
jgi:hypothetical protein